MHIPSRSIIRAILPDYPDIDEPHKYLIISDILKFIRQELKLAPFHIRLGIVSAGISLELIFNVLRFFKRSHSPAQATIYLFERFGGSIGHSYIRLLRSLSIVVFMEHSFVIGKMGINETIAMRQRKFRLIRKKEVESSINE